MSINKPGQFQPNLFELMPDKQFTSAGESRARYGNEMEYLVCCILGLTKIEIDPRKETNFDAIANDIYYEIKSVKHSQKVCVYKFRLEKERQYQYQLKYVAACHKVKEAKSIPDIWDQLEEKGVELIILPFFKFYKIAKRQELRKCKTEGQSGYDREGYKDGYYNVPVKELKTAITRSGSIEIYGKTINYKIKQ